MFSWEARSPGFLQFQYYSQGEVHFVLTLPSMKPCSSQAMAPGCRETGTVPAVFRNLPSGGRFPFPWEE